MTWDMFLLTEYIIGAWKEAGVLGDIKPSSI